MPTPWLQPGGQDDGSSLPTKTFDTPAIDTPANSKLKTKHSKLD